MARDLEFNVTASDKTGTALASAERQFRDSQKRIRSESDKTSDTIGKGLKDGVGKAAPGMLQKIQGVFSTGGVSGGQLLAGALVAASPLLGATISAAIIGGAGVGGVVGGVVLAARDPRVKAAGADLGESLLGDLTKDADVFVEPLLKNIAKVEGRFGEFNGRISNIFKNSAGFLDPLVDGALNAVGSILRGFDVLVAKGGPVMASLGKAFSTIGDAIGDSMEIIAGDAEDSAKALDTMAGAVGGLIKASAYLVRALTEVYGVVSYIPGKIQSASNAVQTFLGVNDQAKTAVSGMATAAVTGAKNVLKVGQEAKAASGPVGTFTDRVNNLTTAGRALYDSTTNVAEATSNLRDKLKENGRTLDENTQKGRDNRNALSNLAGALVAKYNAEVTANGETRKSNTLAQQNRDAFVRLAQQFGLTKTAAQQLATQFGLIPSKKNTTFAANTHDAEARAKALQEKINNVHGKSVTIGVNFSYSQAKLNQINNTLDRLGGSGLLSQQSFAFASPESSAGARTGGPAPINLTSEVSVLLDGTPFYGMSVRAAQAAQRRSAFRARVGKR